MEEDRSHMTGRILDLTLEIIYLLTGEGYKVVKDSSGELWTPVCPPNQPSHITVPPLPYLIFKENNDKKILEIINKMIGLLTGEVPIRCQDVSVYFSMEEWEYLEGHKDLYKDIVMMEDQPPLKSLDGSRNRKPPERCPRPLDSQESTQEGNTTPPQDQGGDQCNFISEVKEENKDELNDKSELPKRHKDLYHDTIVESYIYRNPPDTCPQALYSTQDDHFIPHHDQSEEDVHMKVEVTMDEGQGGMENWQCAAEVGLKVIVQEDSSLDGTSAYLQDIQHSPKGHLTSYPDFTSDYYGTSQPSPGLNIVTQAIHLTTYHKNRSVDSSVSVGNDENLPQRQKKIFPCSQCDKSFTSESAFAEHQSTHTRQRPFVCLQCGSSFVSKSCFARHQRHHSEVRPYSCTVCGKSFKEKSVLIQHLRCHTGERPFACSECGQRFTQKAHLGRHLRVHTGETPFSCKQCGKSFMRKDMLSVHVRRHMNESPFSCPVCGKCFKQQFCLVRHQKLHTESSFSCSNCSSSFKNISEFLIHLRSHTTQ